MSKVIDTGQEVLDLQTVKRFLVVTHAENDNFISYLIRSARTFIEREIDLDIVEKTRIEYMTTFADLNYDKYGGRFLYLHSGPVKDIESITHSGGIEFTDFRLYNEEIPTRIYIDNVPTTNNAYHNIEIRYTTGVDELSEDILQLMLLTIGDWYEQRQDSIPINYKSMQLGVDRLKNLIKNQWL